MLLTNARNIAEIYWAALELRMCLERLSLEYLALLAHNKRKLSKNETKRYQPTDIIPRLLKEVPYFEKMVDSINAVFNANGMSGDMHFPEMQWFNSTYGKLGNYLHCQRDPLSTEELVEFADFIGKAWKETFIYVKTRANIGKLTPHAEDIFDRYVNGVIDQEQMQRMINSSNIPPNLLDPE